MADGSKTEQATEQRRKKAREKGSVVRSRELPGLAASAAAAAVLAMTVPLAVTRWSVLYRSLIDLASVGDLDLNGPVLFLPAVEVMRWTAPVLLAALMGSACTGLLQGGINIAPNALALKFERFSPAAKLGQIFSPVGLANLLKSLLPFSVMVWVGCGVLQENWGAMVGASTLGLRSFAAFVGGMIFTLTWKCGLVLAIWAAVDYLLTWRKMESDLKMSKQEVREEHKETDGNPQVKSRIRSLRRRLRKAQSLKAAANATVVVTNPTHFAVALRYEAGMDAPIVVAKGLDLLAQEIKRIAVESGVVLMENRPLAQALYKSVEVGDSIPAQLYQAVAEILVLVYRAQADVRRQEAERRSKDASGRSSNTTKTADMGGVR